VSDLPRVTEILAAVNLGPDLSDVPEDVLAFAQQRGRVVHQAIEQMVYACFDPSTFPEESQPYLDAYGYFLQDSGFEPKYSEIEIRSERWRYRGHPDLIGFLGQQRVVIDAKSGMAKRVEYQLAGYRIAWNEERPTEPIHSAMSLQLRRDGSYRMTEHDMTEAEPVFCAAATVFHAQRRSS
jgi:hypothetical protein